MGLATWSAERLAAQSLPQAVAEESVAAARMAAEKMAADIVAATGIDAGMALVIAADGELACAMADKGRLLTHLLVPKADGCEALRATVAERGLGGRVVIHALAENGRLPHPDRFVNLAVADLDALGPSAVAAGEIERVLAPRGASYLKHQGRWSAAPAKKTPGLGDWTHRFFDASGNCVSPDELAGFPRVVQWQHGPAMEDGTADGKVPRVADGRFLAFDATSGDLVCRDAGNGALLWRRFIGSPQNADLAVVAGQVILHYDETLDPAADNRRFAERGPLVALELTTGKLAKTYDESLPAGGARRVLAPHHEDESRQAEIDPTPWFVVRDDVIAQTYGSELVVLERATGKRRFTKTLEPTHNWFSPTLAGDLLLAAEVEGAGRRGRHDGATRARALVAFALADGAPRWRQEDAHPLRAMKDKSQRAFSARAEFKPISVADGLVLAHVSSYQFRQGGRVAVLEAGTGRELWHRDFQPGELYTQGSQRAILRKGEVVILDGLGVRRYDARSGAPLGEPITLPKDPRRQARPNGACTASRATVNWLLCNATLYVGPQGETLGGFGARGACGQGVVPAQGLLYVNPTACDCGDYTRGYLALAPRWPGEPIDDARRLTHGPAHADTRDWKLGLGAADWPMFLGDPARRCRAATTLPERLGEAWRQRLATPRGDALEADRRQSEYYLGALSAPVAAAGLVVVAAPESHQVIARDAATGAARWTYFSPAKVDSPPTLLLADNGGNSPRGETSPRGLAVLGCDDGAVVALRLADGAVAWRFAAAATTGLAARHGHLASVTPLPGSVLALPEGDAGATVLVAAGHHTDLGGLLFFALDAATGAVRARRVIGADQPAVVTSDILVGDLAGASVWLGNGQSMLRLSPRLDDLPIEVSKVGAAVNRPPLAFDRQGARLRFRADIGRGGSTHGWKGAVRSASTSAHRAAVDGDITFALRDPTLGERHPVRSDQTPVVAAFVVEGRERRQLWFASARALGTKASYSAICKAGDRLYLGGGSRDGADGFVQVLDAADGRLLAEHTTPSRLVECGLAAASGRLFVSCEGGELVCLGEVK